MNFATVYGQINALWELYISQQDVCREKVSGFESNLRFNFVFAACGRILSQQAPRPMQQNSTWNYCRTGNSSEKGTISDRHPTKATHLSLQVAHSVIQFSEQLIQFIVC